MNRSILKFAVLPVAALAAGLGLSAATPAPAASVGPFAAPAAGPADAPQTWRVDGLHSSVVFRIKHLGVSNFYGSIKDIGGTIVLDPDDAEASSVEITLDAGSIDTRNSKRDQHAMSPDFLNAKEFPSITYKSSKVAGAGEGKWSVEGELTLHGETRPLDVTVERTGVGPGMRGEGQVAGFECRFEFKRSDFGMDNLLEALGDEVAVIFAVEAGLQ
jgi:polyisoprenoid-binding protein YceI